ncbi:TetR/AcrR family transcriptional regulator [Lacrimispora xylanisolvens]|uniref:TetR/AcrR family transcriptional regulator n=1 Tax=Lacrimispora xylanisolvens TaxID=384636 RepID=UPI0024028FDB|nr:TetR/AcrR family transcriptional regulator [Paenibacillaceae bacterium]
MKSIKDATNLTSRDLQAIERREQLLESAKELFALKGFHATTTREITRNIGMADGLIYHYFPEGKKQMLDIILKEFLDDRYLLVEAEIAALEETLSLKELLISLGNIFFAYIAKDKYVLQILLKEKSVFSDEYTERFSQHVSLLLGQTMKRVQVFVDRKEIRSFDIFMMVNQFWSAIYSYILQDVFFGNHSFYHSDREHYLIQVVEYTLLTWEL